MGRIAAGLAVPGQSLGRVAANPDMRRLQGAWGLGIAADWTFLVVALVSAYDAAGPLGVGILGLVRMVPATVVSLAVVVPDRVPQERVLVAINALRAGGAGGGMFLLALGGPPAAIFACAGLVAASGALVRPTQNGLLPAIARSPDELVAANVATSTAESVGMFVGPLVGGLLLATGGPATAAAAAAVAFAAAAVGVMAIRIPPGAATVDPRSGAPGSRPLVEGVDALRRHRGAAVVVGAFVAQVLVRGLLTTLIVVTSIELIGLGEAGVGWLNGAIGFGGFVGAVASIALAGRSRLAPAFAVALVGWGAPIALIGAAPVAVLAVAALLVVGTSNAVLDVSGFTLLQRTVPNRSRVAVLRLLEGGIGVGVGVGGVLAPVLIEAVGVRGSLALTGAVLPVVALVAWPRLSRLDRETVVPGRELGLLRGIPLFAPLPLTALERIAGSMRPLTVGRGDVLIREGEPGDRYYVVAEGAVEASQGGRTLRRCGPGDGVGEIALVRGVARTATVTAVEPTTVYALESADFLAALTGHPGSEAAAATVIDERLATPAAPGSRPG